MGLTYKAMQDVLMKELRLYHYPIAVNFFFDEARLEKFKQTTPHVAPVKPLAYCQLEIAARMQGQTVLAGPELMGCSGARISFGWQEVDEREIKAHAKYAVSLEQAERFVRSKPSLPMSELKAVSVGPLGEAVIQPDVVHFYCDNMQSYHLAVDYSAATDTHPLRPLIMVSSAACGGGVQSFLEKTFNACPACSGAYNAGKTERGELNVFIPGEHIGPTVERLLSRLNDTGGSSVTRAGDPFPGADICKNCPLIAFKKAD